MTDHKGRLIVFNSESHLEAWADLAAGDTLEVVRGNGPREGEFMGVATVTEVSDDGPALSIHFWGKDDFTAAEGN